MYLPQEEVTESDLTRGPDQQVRVGGLGGIQALLHQVLRHITFNRIQKSDMSLSTE